MGGPEKPGRFSKVATPRPRSELRVHKNLSLRLIAEKKLSGTKTGPNLHLRMNAMPPPPPFAFRTKKLARFLKPTRAVANRFSDIEDGTSSASVGAPEAPADQHIKVVGKHVAAGCIVSQA